MTDLRHVLAVNMKARRQNLGLSQSNLAEKINAATNYISKIESERQFPSVPMLEKIAHALESDTLDLFSVQGLKKNRIGAIRTAILNEVETLIIEKMKVLEEDL